MAQEFIIHPLRCGTIHPPLRKGSLRRTTLPVWCYLVEYSHGLLLINTGLGTEPLGPFLENYYRPELGPGEGIAEQLARRGIAPGDLDLVLLTHFYPDHTGGVRSLHGAKRILVSDEEYYWTPRTVFAMRQPRKLWDSEPVEVFYFRGSPLGPQKHSLDLFGDESLTAVLTPGPTFGMASLLLQNGGRRVVFAADLIRSPKSYEEGYVFHPNYQKKSVDWLRSVQQDPSCLAVLTSHDPDLTGTPIRF